MKDQKEQHQDKLGLQRKYNYMEFKKSEKAMQRFKEKPYQLRDKSAQE